MENKAKLIYVRRVQAPRVLVSIPYNIRAGS